ncbi:MAG: PKD domain-containing protein [Candidatus Pacearchaeota archaeon]
MEIKTFFRICSFIVVILIFAISCFLASAEIKLGNFQIDKEYSAGEQISGWINISLVNEVSTNKLTDSFNNEKLLINALKNSSYIYSCIPLTCNEDYATSGEGFSSKTITLASLSQGLDSKIIGMKLTGKEAEATNFSFFISTNAPASCKNQLSIDLLDNSRINWENQNYTNENCGSELKSKCHSSETFDKWHEISESEYCEKINISKSPAFEVKAKLKKSGTATGNILARIYDSSGILGGECEIDEPTSTSGEYLSCIIEYLPKKAGEQYICIVAEEGTNPDGYYLSGGSTGEHCGLYFEGTPIINNPLSQDYEITAQAKKYAQIASFSFNNKKFEEYNGDSLTSYINDYLSEVYNSNCENSCIIPIAFAGEAQDISASNIDIEYAFLGSGGTSSDKAYELKKTPAKISLGYQKINLDSLGFKTPYQKGNYTYILNFNNSELAKENISVIEAENSKIKAIIYPRATAVAFPTLFSAYVGIDLNKSGIQFTWDFGDGSLTETSSKNKLIHSYSSVGNYTLKLTVRKDGKESINEFYINVTLPNEAINSTLKEYKERLVNVKSQIEAFPSDYQDILNNLIGIRNLESRLTEAINEYKNMDETTPDQEYIRLMSNLINEMEIPYSAEASTKSDIPLINNIEIIDLDKINILFGQRYDEDDAEEYKNAILSWSLENIKASIAHQIISVYYPSRRDDALSEFIIKITPKEEINYDSYLIVEYGADNMIMPESYREQNEEDLTGFRLELTKERIIQFTIKGEGIDVFSIPMYISPRFDELSLPYENNPRKGGFNWKLFSVSMIILIFIVLAIYILLQEWYKKNYESHLFKDRNELFNLMSFISNAKKRGMLNSKIKEALKKSGWKAEQTEYAIRKIDGKRVGMWEIPIFSRYQNKKIKEELEKRKRIVY